jgi:acyl-CoA dehydrogenase
MAKIIVPQMALRVLDRAIQAHGAAGVSQDFPLAYMYAIMRTLRIADGPDQVHSRQVTRMEMMRGKELKERYENRSRSKL